MTDGTFSTSSNRPGTPLTIDDILKMKQRLAEIQPMPRVDAILFTAETNLIPEGSILQANHEGKTYFLMQKNDLDKMKEEANYFTFKHVRVDMVNFLPPGAIGVIVGIPIYEDTQTIRKILIEKIEESLWKLRISLQPYINPFLPPSPPTPSS